MRCGCNQTDFGPDPFVTNVEQMAMTNRNFRSAIWTGCNLQMTLMNIPPCGEIGVEMHEDTDQFLRVEQGCGVVRIGECKCTMDVRQCIQKGDVVFVPAGTWHNVVNMGRCPLKISSIYAPPNHPWGTMQRTKEEAEEE